MGRHNSLLVLAIALGALVTAQLGACGPPCSHDTDCEGAMVCEGYVCVDPDNTQAGLGLCDFDWDCAATETCRSGSCVDRTLVAEQNGTGGGAGGGAGGGCGGPSCIGTDPLPIGGDCGGTVANFTCSDSIFDPNDVYLLIPSGDPGLCWIAHWKDLEQRTGYVDCAVNGAVAIDGAGRVVYGRSGSTKGYAFRFKPDATYTSGTVTDCPGAGVEPEDNDAATTANPDCTRVVTTIPIASTTTEVFFECAGNAYYTEAGTRIDFNSSTEPGYIAGRGSPLTDVFQWGNVEVASSTKTVQSGSFDHIQNDAFQDENRRLIKGDVLGIRSTGEGYRVALGANSPSLYRAVAFPDERFTYGELSEDYALPAGLDLVTGFLGVPGDATYPEMLSAIDRCGNLFIEATEGGVGKVVRIDPDSDTVQEIWADTSTVTRPIDAITGP